VAGVAIHREPPEADVHSSTERDLLPAETVRV
jgi:hypothetical protein